MASFLGRCAYLSGALALVCCAGHGDLASARTAEYTPAPRVVWRSTLAGAAEGPARLTVDGGSVWVSAAHSTSILDLRTGAVRWRVREPARIVRTVGRDIVALRRSSLVRYGPRGDVERQLPLCVHDGSRLAVDFTRAAVAGYCYGERRFTIRNARTFAEDFKQSIDARSIAVSKLSDWGFALTRLANYPASHETLVYRRAENRLRSIGRAVIVASSGDAALLLNPLDGDDVRPARRYQMSTLPARKGPIEYGRVISCPRGDCEFAFALGDVLYLSDAPHHELYEVRARGSEPARSVKAFTGRFDRVIAATGNHALVQTTAGDLFVISRRAGAHVTARLGRAGRPAGVRGISTAPVAIVSAESPGTAVVVDLQTGERFETGAKLIDAVSAGAGRIALLAISGSGAFEVTLLQERR